MYVVQQGGNPIKVAKVQIEAMRSLDGYLKDSRDLLRMKGENMADPRPEKVAIIKRLEDERLTDAVGTKTIDLDEEADGKIN